MARTGSGAADANALGVLLAFLAVFLNVLIPQGTMAARRGDAVAIVICTGHGPLVAPGRPDTDKSGAAHHDSACAFAGHGLMDAPPVLAVQTVSMVLAEAPIAGPGSGDLVPGRGLAAPPPPAQGPPRLI